MSIIKSFSVGDGDITFECVTNKVHIYVSNSKYEVDFLDDEDMSTYNYYLGTLNL